MGYPTILHLHIPRTAGSSVHAVLGAYAKTNGVTLVTSSHAQVAAEITKLDAPPALITGHFAFGLHTLVPNPFYFIVMRDPVERVASLIRFIMSRPEHAKHALVSACNGDPQKIYRQRKRGGQFDNGATRQLSGSFAPGYIWPWRRRRALQALQGRPAKVVVTTPQRLRHGLDRLGAELGFSFADPEIHNACTGDMPSEAARHVIAAHNRIDAEFYRRVAEQDE
ncbi:MAG: hypothetical protein WC684_09385 [Hyphomicrobium sp.]